MTAPRYRESKWKGLPSFECEACPFATLDHGAIVNHVKRRHPTTAELGGSKDPLAGVPWASASAEGLAKYKGLEGSDFHGHEPTGKAGFNMDDVRHIAASRTPEEEE